MTKWRNEVRTCGCGETFKPRREGQRHCSASCRDIAKKRVKRSGDKTRTPMRVPRSGNTALSALPGPFADGSTVAWLVQDFPHGPTPGALQGDDYPLTYDENGYPELPACLDRRSTAEPLAEAA
jgi:hypothetical protein